MSSVQFVFAVALLITCCNCLPNEVTTFAFNGTDIHKVSAENPRTILNLEGLAAPTDVFFKVHNDPVSDVIIKTTLFYGNSKRSVSVNFNFDDMSISMKDILAAATTDAATDVSATGDAATDVPTTGDAATDVPATGDAATDAPATDAAADSTSATTSTKPEISQAPGTTSTASVALLLALLALFQPFANNRLFVIATVFVAVAYSTADGTASTVHPGDDDMRVEVEVLLPKNVRSYLSIDWLAVQLNSTTPMVLHCANGYSSRTLTGNNTLYCLEDYLKDYAALKASTMAIWDKPAKFDKKATSYLTSEFNGTIMMDCFSVNGNGFNWAATLSFLSEALSVKAKQAEEKAKDTGKDVYIYPWCIIGGSSGSAVVGVYLNLLRNEELFHDDPVLQIDAIPVGNGVVFNNSRLFKPSQLRKLSDALRFITYTVDFTNDETAAFLPRYLGSKIGLGSKNVLEWWKENMNPFPAQVLFSVHALMARYVTKPEYDVPVKQMLEESGVTGWIDWGNSELSKLESISSSMNMTKGHSVMESPTDKNDTDYESKKKIKKAQYWWAKKVGHRVNQRLYSQAGKGAAYRLRLVAPDIDQDTPLNTMLKEKLHDGFATMAMGVLFDTEAAMLQNKHITPVYADARPIIACNSNTAQVILNDPSYREDVKNSSSFISRFVIIVVESYFEAYNFGVREPYTFRILAKTLDEFGVKSMYDPLQDENDNGRLTYKLVNSKDVAVAVLGGYATGNMMALFQSYYISGLSQSMASNAPHATIMMRQTRFLKTTPPSFALSVIDKLLCGPEDGENYAANKEKAREDWKAFEAAYDLNVPDMFEKLNVTAIADQVKVDWGVQGSTLPPAAGGESYIIDPRSVQAVRKSLDPLEDYPDAFLPSN